jgi:hypothetical protein
MGLQRSKTMSANEARLLALETLIGASLPSDYRDFMLAGDISAIREKEYWVPHPAGRWIETITEFHTIEQLLQLMALEMDLRRQGFGDHPNGTLPIANDGCGDSVLLSYRDQDSGAVFHEFLEEANMQDPWKNAYLLAPTFTEWRRSLQTIEK